MSTLAELRSSFFLRTLMPAWATLQTVDPGRGMMDHDWYIGHALGSKAAFLSPVNRQQALGRQNFSPQAAPPRSFSQTRNRQLSAAAGSAVTSMSLRANRMVYVHTRSPELLSRLERIGRPNVWALVAELLFLFDEVTNIARVRVGWMGETGMGALGRCHGNGTPPNK